jgi:hypothetical protein
MLYGTTVTKRFYEENIFDCWHYAERAQATRVRAAGRIAASAAKPQKQVTYAVNVFWPWFVLVLSDTLLWLERKLTPVSNFE